MTNPFDEIVAQNNPEVDTSLPDDLSKETPEEVNPFDDIVAKGLEDTDTMLAASVNEGTERQPDRQKEVREISSKYNLPPSFIDDNFEDFKKDTKQAELRALNTTNPKLGKFFQDPDNVAIAHDDIESLKQIEIVGGRLKEVSPVQKETTLTEAIGQGVSHNFTQVSKFPLYMSLINGRATPEDMAEIIAQTNIQMQSKKDPQFYQRFQKQKGKEVNDLTKTWAEFKNSYEKDWEDDVLNSVANFGSKGFETVGELFDVLSVYATNPRSGVYSASQSLINSFFPYLVGAAAAPVGTAGGAGTGAVGGAAFGIPGIAAGGIIGGSVGGAGAFVTASTLTGTALEFTSELEGLLQSKGVDITDPKALVAAFKNKELMEEVKSRALKKSITTAAVDTLFSLVGARILKGKPVLGRSSKVTEAAEKLAKPSKLTKIGRVAKAQAVEIAGEGVSEFSGAVARDGEVTLNTVLESVEESWASIFIGGGAGSTSYVLARTGDLKQSLSKNPDKASMQLKELYVKTVEATNFQDNMDQLIEVSKESKLKGRDQEAFVKVVNDASENQAVYFQADEWDDHWKKQGENPSEKADELLPGGKEDLDNARSDGDSIRVPLGDYVSKFPEETSFADLSKLVKQNPEAMNATQAESIGGEIDNVLKEVSKDAKKELKKRNEREASERSIRNNIQAQLREAGRDVKESKKLADIYSSVVNVNSTLLGLSPEEVFKLQALEIKKFDQVPGRGEVFQLDKESGLNLRKGEKVSQSFKNVGQVVRRKLTDFKRPEGKFFLGGKDTVTKANQILVGQSFNSVSSGRRLKIGELAIIRGLDKIYSSRHASKASEKKKKANFANGLTAIKNLPDLIETSVHVSSEGNVDNFYSVGQGDRANIGVKLVVRNNTIEDVEVFDFKKQSEVTLEGAAKAAVQGATPDPVSISDFRKFINAGREVESKLFQADSQNEEKRLQELTNTQEFKDFFKGSKVVDEEGKPLIIHHGTTHDFDTFDTQLGNIENDFGKGIYFTDNETDVSINYAGEGPDLTGRIEQRAERIESDEDIDSDEALAQAREELLGSEAQTVPVFVNISNPVVLGGKDETVFDIETEFDEDGDIVSEEGSLLDFAESLRNVSRDFQEIEVDEVIGEIFEAGFEGIKASDLVKLIKESEAVSFSTDDEGQLASSEIIRAAFEDAGFDGIIDHTVNEKFGTERKFGQPMEGVDADTTHYIAFNSNQIKSVHNQGTFDPSDPNIFRQEEDETVRGFLDLSDPLKLVIGLLAKANKSTTLHEMGHVFLENMKVVNAEIDKRGGPKNDIQRQFKEDISTLLEEFGVDSLDKVTVEHHEKFARLTEAYFLEGKSPSKKLRSAFNTFKTWLMNIYKNLAGIEAAAGTKLNLTPELREVFNRMLATQEEIAEINVDMGYDRGSLVELFEKLGIKNTKSSKDLDKLLLLHQEASSEAELELYRKHLEQIKKKKTKEYKAVKKQLTSKYTEEAEKLDLYIAIDAIKTGKIKDQDVLGFETLKIDTVALKELLGTDRFRSFPRSLYSSEGIHPDSVAELLGFNNGKELVETISNNPNKKQFIKQSTQLELDRLFPNYMSPEQQQEMKVEAINFVHNEKRSEALQLELDLMFKTSPAQVKKLMTRISSKLPNTKQFKNQAEAILSTTSLKNSSPSTFTRIENKARREASEYLLIGEFEKALRSKMKEMLNHELSKQAGAQKIFVDKSLKKNREKLRKSDKDLANKGQVDTFKAAQSIMSRYGMITDVQVDRLESSLQQIQAYDPLSFDKVKGLSDSLVNIPDQPFNELTGQEFNEVIEVVEALQSLAISENKIEVDGKKVEKAKIIEDLKRELITTNERAVTKEDTPYKKFKGFVSSLTANMTRVEHLIDSLDKHNFSGPFRTFIFNRANDAQTTYNQTLEKNYDKLNKLLSDKFGDILKDDQDIDLTKYFTGLDPELTSLKKFEVIMAMVHSGNDSNKRKLLLGRGWGTENIDGTLNTKQYDAFINHMFKRGILTKDIMDGVQGIWDLFEELKPEIQKVHKEVYGYFFKEIKPKSFKTPVGTYKGGYAPAVTDSLLVEAEASRQNELSVEQESNQFAFAHTPKGFTKDRVQAYNRALSLDFRAIRSHVEKAVRFSTLEGAVTDLNKIINNKSFSDTMFKVNNNWGNEVFRPWLARLATQQTERPSDTKAGREFGKWLRFFRKNANMQLMFMNVVNTVENLTDIPALFTKMKARSFNQGLKRYIKSPTEATNMIKDLSPDMKDRLESEIFDINDKYKEIVLDKPGALGQIRKLQDLASKHTFILQRSLQNVVEISAWLGAYDEALVSLKDTKKAARKADSIIRTVMGSNRPIDLAKIESGSAMQKVVLTFYSYFLNKGNLAFHSSRENKFKAYALAMATPAILSAIFRRAVKGNWDEDGDDEYVDDMFDVFIASQLRFSAAVFPGGGTTVRFIEGQFNDKAYDDRLSISPLIGMVESAKGVRNLVTKDEIRGRDLRDSMNYFGTLTGLPIGPVGKPVGFMIDVEQGKQQVENPVDLARGLTTGRSGKRYT